MTSRFVPETRAQMANCAEDGLAAYAKAHCSHLAFNDVETWAADFLCDLHHLFDAMGLDFTTTLARALANYREAQADCEEGQFEPCCAWVALPPRERDRLRRVYFRDDGTPKFE